MSGNSRRRSAASRSMTLAPQPCSRSRRRISLSICQYRTISDRLTASAAATRALRILALADVLDPVGVASRVGVHGIAHPLDRTYVLARTDPARSALTRDRVACRGREGAVGTTLLVSDQDASCSQGRLPRLASAVTPTDTSLYALLRGAPGRGLTARSMTGSSTKPTSSFYGEPPGRRLTGRMSAASFSPSGTGLQGIDPARGGWHMDVTEPLAITMSQRLARRPPGRRRKL